MEGEEPTQPVKNLVKKMGNIEKQEKQSEEKKVPIAKPKIDREALKIKGFFGIFDNQIKTATRTVTPRTNYQVSKKLPNCKHCQVELKIDSPQTYLCSNCGRKFSRKVQAIASKKSSLIILKKEAPSKISSSSSLISGLKEPKSKSETNSPLFDFKDFSRTHDTGLVYKSASPLSEPKKKPTSVTPNVGLSRKSRSIQDEWEEKKLKARKKSVDTGNESKKTSLKCPKCKGFLEEYSESLVYCSSCNKKYARKKK